MHLRSLICALLLALLVTGCATMSNEGVGINRDSYEKYTNVYADSKQITVCYSNYGGQGGDSSRRWATLDLDEIKWVTITATAPGQVRVTPGMRQPQEFMPYSGPCKPEAGAGLKEISFYYSADGKTLKHTNPESAPIPMGEIEEVTLHRQDPDRAPFTAYGGERYVYNYKRTLVLIRDDPAHPGQLQAAVLASKNDLHPVMRKAMYPFAVAFDVVTLPFQIIFFLFYNGA